MTEKEYKLKCENERLRNRKKNIKIAIEKQDRSIRIYIEGKQDKRM